MIERISCPIDECSGVFEVEITTEQNYGTNRDGMYGNPKYFIDEIESDCVHEDNENTVQKVQDRIQI